MFLAFTLVLLAVAMGILASVYAVFFPFMQNIGTVTQYHMAYYGALSAVERAELGLRYRSPGFVGSGGFFGFSGYGPLSDYTPELLSGANQGFMWSISSRTTSIPGLGMGNTDSMLSDITSKDYNALGYIDLETFLLSYDAITQPELYYSGVTQLSYFSGGSLTGLFRLPPKIHGLFGDISGLLCTSSIGGCDPDGDGLSDDMAVSWSLAGLYKDNGFKIFPTIAVFYYSGMQIDTSLDTAIRESMLNETGVISFDTSFSHRFTPVINGSKLTQHNVVSSVAGDIQHQSFPDILSFSSVFSNLRLSFGAMSLFRTTAGAIYPYIEYQFTFPQPIADRFYFLQGNGRAGEYDVQIFLKKPTVQGTVGGDFTVVF